MVGVVRHVAVIGAGAAGLITAKTLLQAGHEVTVLEMGGAIGGMWNYQNDSGTSVAYRNLHINTDTYVTQLPDHPFPEGAPAYAHHSAMYAYLKGYAERFGVLEHVRFRSPVTHFTQAAGGGWEVQTSGEGSGHYDAVVVATGHLNKPRWPDLPGTFDGTYLHSAAYRVPEPFADQRVCLMGLGNSSMDIASDLAHIARRLVVSARHGAVIWPKFVFGYPLTRLSAKVQEFRYVPLAVRNRLFKLWNRFMVFVVWGPMRGYGIELPSKPGHPVSNQFFLSHVKYGRVVVKPDVRAVAGRTITFEDGTSEDFDVLIAATGYTVDFPFLEAGLVSHDDTRLPLYKRVVPPDRPGLYFVGYFNIDWSSLPVYEQQALWVADLEAGRCALPSPAQMWADVRAREEAVARKYLSSPRMNLEVEYGPYVAELRAERKRPALVRASGGAPRPPGPTASQAGVGPSYGRRGRGGPA
jgi:dimethylaniline monooxygenase (N-oxide forming)